MKNEALKTALAFFDKGLKVFPIKENSKIPAVANWQAWAKEAKRENIETYATYNLNSNWAVFCGASKIAVIDIDTKKNGFENYKNLKVETPETYSVKTPSGGRHLYFIGSCKCSVSLIAEGVDTRGEGGYVLIPGSRINGELYKVENNKSMTALPLWVNGLLRKKEPSTLSDTNPVLEGERNATLASLAGSMRKRGMGFEAILSALLVVNDTQLENPLHEDEVKTIAKSIARYAPQEAVAASDFMNVRKLFSKRASDIDVTSIKKRSWIMENRYIGGYMSAIIAPGGVGKSTITMLDAISIATGESLSGFKVKQRGGVWIYNTEDPLDELERRLVGMAIAHGVNLNKLDNIHISSGRSSPLIIAKSGYDGIVINKDAVREIVETIEENNIKLFIVDPFVNSHECSENDNMEIAKVSSIFQRIADTTDCAVCVVHHSRKPGKHEENAGDANQARGASSLINSARLAHTIAPMGQRDADLYGFSKHDAVWYIRLDNAKANLSAPTAETHWFKRTNVNIPNGDSVGALKKVDLKCGVDERSFEEKKYEIKDLTIALTEKLKKGQSIGINELYEYLFKNPHYQHLFGNSSQKEGKEYLLSMLQRKLVFENKIFYVDYEKKAGQYIIYCEDFAKYLS